MHILCLSLLFSLCYTNLPNNIPQWDTFNYVAFSFSKTVRLPQLLKISLSNRALFRKPLRLNHCCREHNPTEIPVDASRFHGRTSERADTQSSFELTMEQYLVERYLARIGYVSGSEQQDPEPDPAPSSDIRLANIEKVQAKILTLLKAQFAAQQQPCTTIPSRPAAQTRAPDLHEEPPSPSTLPNAPSTTSTPRAKTNHQPFKPRRGPKSRPPPPPPPLATKAEILARLYPELERRQKLCSALERQIEARQTQIRAHPSKRQKIDKEHAERIAKSATPVHNDQHRKAAVAERKAARTAEDADREATRDDRRRYDRASRAVPTPEPADALPALMAPAERRLKDADAGGTLRGAKCALFATGEEIGGVGYGVGELRGGDGGIEGRGEGRKGKRRGGKGGGVRVAVGGWGEGGGTCRARVGEWVRRRL